MAGRENQGALWVLSSGLDLQLPIVCDGFKTLSLASVQSLGHRDASLMKLALDLAWTRKWRTMCLKSGYTSSKWLNCDWGGLIRLSVKMIQWFSCVNVTPQSNSERQNKRDTSGYFRDILIHYANKASGWCLLLQSKVALGFWVLLDWPAWCIEEILAIKPICGNSPGCDFLRWRSNYPCNFDDTTPELHTEQ